MRSFGIVSPQFWTGRTGKEIQAAGAEAIILATYLMTSPHSHMCGVYYLSKQYVSIDTGRPIKAIEKAFHQLATLPSGAFAYYDQENNYVWVPEMLAWQVGELKPQDSRIRGIIKWYESLPSIPFVAAFFDRYSNELPGLTKREITKKNRPVVRGVEGAVADANAPTYPSPVLSPVLSLEGGAGETKPHGEFGHVKLTESQHDKLKAKLNGKTDDYIARFDNWVQQAPDAKANGVKRRDRDAYSSILAWHAKDVAEGRVEARASPDEIHAKAEAHRLKIFGKGK